jgi:mannitol 2-dehydrogenase
MDELATDPALKPIRLSQATLAALPPSVKRPHYDRTALTAGMVHIGVGNFHRAHQAWYLHRLMQMGVAQDWAIIGAGVRAYDADLRQKLLAQDCLTTLIELDPKGKSAEVIGPMVDYLPVEVGNRPLVGALAQPTIRIVTLTVTEGGYYVDPATNGFDAAHPDIVYDTANPETPRTGFGAIIAALRLRRDAGLGPITVLSCDNLQGNGAIVRQTVLSLARLTDDDLADWIEETCSFPNSMVDSIVPATGSAEVALAARLGVIDAAPVAHENFRQWVMEDDFCAGRPDWDRVGATFSSDVHAYEAMKLRILNAGHQILANAGELLNLPTIDACMAHPLVGGFFAKVQREEIVPHVPGVPDMTAEAYLDQVTVRFENPAIADTTRRVAFDGSARHTGFVHPVIRDALAAGAPIAGLALAEALWARMCYAEREDGTVLAANDPHWIGLVQAARRAKSDPGAWINQKAFYGDLATSPAFAQAFDTALAKIWAKGVETALADYIG